MGDRSLVDINLRLFGVNTLSRGLFPPASWHKYPKGIEFTKRSINLTSHPACSSSGTVSEISLI